MSITRLTNWLRSSRTAKQKLARKSDVALRTESLEDRDAPAIFTVTWDGNPTGPVQPAGSMTLQQAIAAANATLGTDQINFGKNFTTGAVLPESFVLSKATPGQNNGALPDITETVTIDGTPFNQTSGQITVHLDSASLADPVNGFNITDGATTKGAFTIIRHVNLSDDKGTQFFNPSPTEYGIKITAVGGNVNLQDIG